LSLLLLEGQGRGCVFVEGNPFPEAFRAENHQILDQEELHQGWGKAFDLHL